MKTQIQKVSRGDDPMSAELFVEVCKRLISDSLTIRSEAVKIGIVLDDPTSVLLFADRVVAFSNVGTPQPRLPEAPVLIDPFAPAAPKKSMREKVKDIMGRSTMSATEIAKALTKNGPWTKSNNPVAVISTLLAVSKDDFQRVRRGEYQVKRAKSSG